MAVWRQAEGAGVRRAPREVQGKEPTSTTKAPLLTRAHKRKARAHPRPHSRGAPRGRGMRALAQCTSASSSPTCGGKVGTQASPSGHAASDTGLKSECPAGCGICGFQGLQTCEQVTGAAAGSVACALRGGASVWADSQPLRRVQQSWHQICARGTALVAL